ncbi:hypothetical protein [Arthrobacter sp. NA-172]|uniref:hypothetical protein n=1 Tax=Arthrobacter sp. NA-172 TaxID=3367524 RepID=UPI003754C5D9
MTLISFGVVALVFGLAFYSPIALVPPPPPGLIILDNIIPLQFWGVAWYIAGLIMFIGAFRQDQSHAMGLFSGLLAVFAISYAWSAIGASAGPQRTMVAFWLQSVIYIALLSACLSVSRLVNAPPVDVDELRKKVSGNSHLGGPDDS